MVKKSVQRGRSERRDQAYSSAVRGVSEQCENNAGGFFTILLNASQPGFVGWIFSTHDGKKPLLKSKCDGPRLSGSDAAIIDFTHRCEFSCRARDEHLIRNIHFVAREPFLDDHDLLLPS